MRGIFWVGLAALALAACGGDGGSATLDGALAGDAGADARAADSGPDASLAALTCAQLSQMFGNTLDAIGNTCVNDDDCMRVGAPPREPMCGCSAGIIVGCGSGANKVAYAGSAAPALAAEFAARCMNAPGLTLTCGCGNYTAHCGGDGSCVASEATACVP